MRIQELFEGINLVTVNKTLNPKLWDPSGKLHDDVHKQLMKIADAFEEFVGVPLNVVDYTVTGSNANFTWTPHSDLDLHVVIQGTPTEQERELFNAKKALWAEQHDITIRGLPVECYVQGDAEEHHSTGVYSLADNKWIVTPKKVKPQIDDSAVTAKADAVIHVLELALISQDLEKLRAAKDRITKMRKAGLARAGEWSVENLVFKLLRNMGLIDKLTERILDLEDQELSLEQLTLD